jgi:FkbM family methyltransferase
MGRLKIAPNRAYCRVATGHGSRRGAADLLQNAIRSSEGGVAWRFQIPFRVAQLRRKARRDIPGARTGSNTGDDVCAWIGARMLTRSSSLRDFYEAYFGSGKEARVIQVGANDGIMCDPLRRFLVHRTNQNIRALLVEPIPYYYTKLRNLYADYPNITVLNVACGASCGRAPIYFIEPSVADQMNGDGPPNDWAHGQGSFDRNVVKYWIERNRFRGEDYVRNIDHYIESIISVDVEIIRLSDIEMSGQNDNLFLNIDVQGFELDVIRGIDWSHPPAYIVVEDYLNEASPIDKYLIARGYFYLCGRVDKVYVHASG